MSGKYLAPAVLLLAANLFGGQSLVLTNGGTSYAVVDPSLPVTQSWRVEFRMHGFTPPPSGYSQRLFTLPGTGLIVYLEPSGALNITDYRDVPTNSGYCTLPTTGLTDVLVRVQRDLVNRQQTCELWNYDGSGYSFDNHAITGPSSWAFSGGAIGNGVTADLAFLRVSTVVLPLGSKPPTTADAGNWTELKFDGNLNDSSGNGHNASLYSGGPPAYVPTPNQTAISVVKVLGTPAWSNWISLRAGFPAQLDGTASFSLADASSSVTYFWQQISGPSNVIWANRTTPQPTLTGLVFGDYVFQLQVTDSAGTSGTAALEVGAVATDNNGVVVNADPRIDQFFGPMIAFGRNPWTWFDYTDMAQYNTWAPNYQVNGGTWRLETDQQSIAGVPRSGTVFVNSSANVLYGNGTDFTSVFCPGGSTPPGYTYVVPLTNNLGPGTAPDVYGRVVTTCNSDTEVTFPSGWSWANPTIPTPGVAWGTFNLCADCGPWTSTQQANSNVNFYDNALGHYALYYRSGWKPARTSAQWLADRWYRSFSGDGIPRDLSLTSAILHATFDTPTYNMWPTIRQSIQSWTMPIGPIQDIREEAYVLLFTAWQAIFDPDPTQAAAARANLVTYYNGVWGPQQQPNGNYVNDEFEGDAGHAFQMTQGSNLATLVFGTPLPSNYCGTVVTDIGTISIGSDRVTITGSGTSFQGVTTNHFMMLAGTLNGKPWSMVSQIASVSGSTIVLVDPWRGDLNGLSPTSWEILSAPPPGNVYYEMYFGKTDANNNLQPNPSFPIVDTDSFYWCSVIDGTHIQLSTVYTGDTSGGNVYRRPSWQNLTGSGSQPFIEGIVAWAFNTSAMALDGYNSVVAGQYRTSANAVAAWITNFGTNPSTGGLFYGSADFSNCRNLSIVPAWDCAQAANGIGASSNSSNERAYLPESMNAHVWRYLSTGSAADQAVGDAVYTTQWARPGFASPFPGDGNFSQSGDPGYFTTKSYGQTFGMGQGHQWPAARLGGVAPPQYRSVLVTVNPPAGASAQIVVTAPSGAQTTYQCGSTSPCSVTVDDRQGSHWYQIQFLSATGQVVSQTDPDLLAGPLPQRGR